LYKLVESLEFGVVVGHGEYVRAVEYLSVVLRVQM
jgi:hypothetical protein